MSSNFGSRHRLSREILSVNPNEIKAFNETNAFKIRSPELRLENEIDIGAAELKTPLITLNERIYANIAADRVSGVGEGLNDRFGKIALIECRDERRLEVLQVHHRVGFHDLNVAFSRFFVSPDHGARKVVAASDLDLLFGIVDERNAKFDAILFFFQVIAWSPEVQLQSFANESDRSVVCSLDPMCVG